jgi:RNA polymerase sigma-70 factor (ECF subfamily)
MAKISRQDKSLLKRCISGDKRSWDSFVERFAGLIYHSVSTTARTSGSVHDPDDLKDITNTVFLLLHENNFKKLRQFEGNCSLASWIRLISVRVTIDHLRKNRTYLSLNGDSETEKNISQSIADEGGLAPDLLEQEERRKIFDKVLDELTPRERMFVELYFRRELPARQVADIMSTTLGAVYTMKNRIREKLTKIVMNFS